ncbi:hypothetical protein CHU98_g11878 [Xylaria longipes]|nr:hypothetical protein CHU98_g11878 [Xylaria longipes]
MCRHWPKGYYVRTSRWLDWGFRPLHRLILTKNPVCAWLPPDVMRPKGWMVLEAQLQDVKRFMQFQYRIRRLPVDKERVGEVDDSDLPPEYYDSFTEDYLYNGYRNFLRTKCSVVKGSLKVEFNLRDPTRQDPETTCAEYILYLAHRFDVVADPVHATQRSAERAVETIRASGILDEVEVDTVDLRCRRDAALREYIHATTTWREALAELSPLWYRVKWAGRQMFNLCWHALRANSRKEKAVGSQDAPQPLVTSSRNHFAAAIELPGSIVYKTAEPTVNVSGDKNNETWCK